jgi:ferredoxin
MGFRQIFSLDARVGANVIGYNLAARPASIENRLFGRGGMAAKLKIHVDQEKCQGHARCKSLAPELFELDQYGNAHEIGDGSVPSGLEDKAWLAQTNCPEIAIEITEE